MLTIKVFLSSPGDVAEERRLAIDTLRGLEDSPLLRGRIDLQVVAWDDPVAHAPLDARETPQASVNRWAGRPADCDLTLVILWGRLGTPLPASLTRADGSRFASGTVWEVEDAIAADRPVFVYRRTEKPRIALDDPDFDARRAQYDAVRRWFDGLRDADGAWRSGVNEYADPAQFQQLLRAHLEAFIGRRLTDPVAPVSSGSADRASPADRTAATPPAPRPPAQPAAARGTDATARAPRVKAGGWLAVGAAVLAVAGALAWGLRASPQPGATPNGQAAPSTTAAAAPAPAEPAARPETTATTAAPPAGAAALPQVRLAGPTEAHFTAMRGSTYSVLSLTPQAGTADRWKLLMQVRLANAAGSGGMNFWDSSFRLLVDGVPRAPLSTLNEIVDAGAAKEGDLVFAVPWDAQTLALRVLHYGESADLPLTVSGLRAPTPAAPAAGPRRVALEGPAELKFTGHGRATYSILSVGTETRRPGVFGLRLAARMHVLDTYAANFGDAQFRLLIDGVPREPDSNFNKVVGGAAAEDGEITFEVPDGARQLVLRVIHSPDRIADVPLKLQAVN